MPDTPGCRTAHLYNASSTQRVHRGGVSLPANPKPLTCILTMRRFSNLIGTVGSRTVAAWAVIKPSMPISDMPFSRTRSGDLRNKKTRARRKHDRRHVTIHSSMLRLLAGPSVAPDYGVPTLITPKILLYVQSKPLGERWVKSKHMYLIRGSVGA